jgi:tetratricopeptide (TPR) repeat protein
MLSVDGVQEPSLVGEGRKLLVDGLVTIFKDVKKTSTPVWVALEAPSGWGKTRIAREFYARLAKEEQSVPAYWPKTVFHAIDQNRDFRSVNARRKRVNPEFAHVPGSLPDYMWWGISCFERGEFVQDALRQDFAILKSHEPYLAITWGRQNPKKRDLVPIFRKLGRGFWAKGKDATKERFLGLGKEALDGLAEADAIAKVVQAISEEIASNLPVFGWLLNVGVSSAFEITNRIKTEAKLAANSDALTHNDPDILLDAYKILTTLSKPQMPVVLFIEDVHNADALLLKLLEMLARCEAPIMIVTTGWTGLLSGDDQLRDAMRIADENLIYIQHVDVTPHPRLPQGASLDQLSTADLRILFTQLHPKVESRTLDLLLAKYTVPLELELVVQAYVSDLDEGEILELSERDVAKLPSSIRDIYLALWKKLPEDLQKALQLSTIGIPAALMNDVNAARTWDNSLVAAALAANGTFEEQPYLQLIDDGRRRYSWVRGRDETTDRQFNEAAQLQVAMDQQSDQAEGKRGKLDRAILVEADRRLTVGFADYSPSSEALEAAAIILAMATRTELGEVIGHRLFMRATLAVMQHVQDQPLELGRRIRLGRDAERRGLILAEADDRTVLLGYARALHESGKHQQTLDSLAPLEQWGPHSGNPNNQDVFEARDLAASALRELGNLDEAQLRFEQLLVDRLRVLAKDHTDVLKNRNNIAMVLWRAGRFKEASEMLEALLWDFETVQGERASNEIEPDELSALSQFAVVLADEGKLTKAEEMFDHVLEHRNQALAPDHPDVLSTRNSLAWILRNKGNFVGAELELRDVLTDRIRILGADHPDVLATRANLVAVLTDRERHEDAETLLGELLADERRIFGEYSPPVLRTQTKLASSHRTAGRFKDAEELLRRVMNDQRQLLGENHPDLLATQNELCLTRRDDGRPKDAVTMFREILADMERIRVLGTGHPEVLTTRNNFANVLRHAADLEDHVLRKRGLEESERVCRALLKQVDKLLDGSHVFAMSVVANLAEVRWELGFYDDAAYWYGLIVSSEVGAMHEDTRWVLAARSKIALCMYNLNDLEAAKELYRELLVDQDRVLGSDDRDVLATRQDLALALAESDSDDDAEEAEEMFQQLLTDQIRLHDDDVDHSEVLRARHDLAVLLEESLDFDEAEAIYRQLLAARRRVHGLGSAEARGASEDLARFLAIWSSD